MDGNLGLLDQDEDKIQIQQHLAEFTPADVTSLHREACSDELDLANHLDLDTKDEKGLTLLHYATIYEKTKNVKLLLESGASVNKANRLGRTALHLSVWGGYKEICKIFLNQHADVTACDESGHTALHWAAIKGKEAIVELLLSFNADSAAPDNHGKAPLHLAAENGHSGVLILLVDNLCKKKGDLNIHDVSGSTALHHAALRAHVTCVSLLIKAGVDLNVEDSEGMTPVHVAAAQADRTCLQLLLNAGADISKTDKYGKTPVHVMTAWGQIDCLKLLRTNNALLQKKDNFGKTPLHLTASWGQVSCMDFLLSAKVDVNAQDLGHQTPLHHAAKWSKSSCVEKLLNAGANACVSDRIGRTPLHYAVSAGSVSCVTSLLDKCSDIDAQQEDGQSALHLAANVGCETIVKLLLDHGANVHLKDNNDRTVFHYAAMKGFAFQLLHQYNPDVTARDKSGNTALHHAIWNGKTAFARSLIEELNADVNVEDNNGMTPILGAALQGQHECMELLIQNLADVKVRDKQWKPVLHYAAVGSNSKCISLLMKQDIAPNRRDKARQTALHYAATLGRLDNVLALLDNNSGRCCDVNAVDKHGDTALHLAVQNNHNNVVYALVETGGADLGIKNNNGKLAIHDAVTDYNKDIFQFLLNRITAQYNGVWMNEFLTSYHVDESGVVSSPLRDLVRSTPESAKDIFDGCIKKLPDKEQSVTVDFQYLDDTSRFPSMQKSSHPMHILANYGNKELLSHPLLLLCLKRKWKVAFFFYIMFLLYFMTFVFLFIAHMLSASGFVMLTKNQTFSQDKPTNFLDSSPYIIYALAVFGMIIELVQVILTRSRYIEWHNICDWVSYIGAVVVVSRFSDTLVIPIWQWQLGCFVVLLQCMNLMFFLRVFPRFGIYVVMVSLILQTFIESFVILFLFIVAFAMTFYLLLFNQYVFSTPGYAIMKSLVMMLGEIDFGNVFHGFRESPSPELILHFESMTYFVFCSFLLISVIIVNLLTGLAVSDVQMLRESSESQMICMQIDLALDLEFSLPKSLHKRLLSDKQKITTSAKLFDMKQLSVMQRLKHSFLSFFQGPLYRQDIIKKIVCIVDKHEYSKKEQNKTSDLDTQHVGRNILAKLDDLMTNQRKNDGRSDKSNKSLDETTVVESFNNMEAWSDSPNTKEKHATGNIEQTLQIKKLANKVDSLSKEIQEVHSMLKSLLERN